jgi:hypothetical protein
MIGLVYLAVFVVYILVALWLIDAAARSARARGIAGWKFGVPVAIVMYLLVFWDHIPTMLVHDYECRNKAGLVVFKTPEQWKVEHPDRAYKARPFSGPTLFETSPGMYGYWLNDSFVRDTHKSESFLLPVRVYRDSIVDARTREVLVEKTWVGSGYSSLGTGHAWTMFKLWVGADTCDPGRNEFGTFEKSYGDIGGSTP